MSDEGYLMCPLCRETDFDRIGLALHYDDCEVAQKLREGFRLEQWQKAKAREASK